MYTGKESEAPARLAIMERAKGRSWPDEIRIEFPLKMRVDCRKRRLHQALDRGGWTGERKNGAVKDG